MSGQDLFNDCQILIKRLDVSCEEFHAVELRNGRRNHVGSREALMSLPRPVWTMGKLIFLKSRNSLKNPSRIPSCLPGPSWALYFPTQFS